jgi:subtilisin-like proprotein convertase family protein
MHWVRDPMGLGRSCGRGPGRATRRAAVAEPLERRALLAASISGLVYQEFDGDGVFEPADGDFGLPGVRVYRDTDSDGQFDDGTVQRFAPGDRVPVTIPDESFIETSIDIDDLPYTVRDVNVHVDITHAFTSDLEATLISPNGREVTLFDSVGNPFFSENFTGTTLDDEAVDRIQEGEAPYSGSFRPMEPLSVMDGETMNGEWTLRIRDWVEFDEGELLNWGLTFDTGNAEPSAFSGSDGRYVMDNLAPGTYRVRQVVYDGFFQTQPSGNGGYVVTLVDGQQVTRNFGQMTGVPLPSVVGRHVFYNRSKFDGHDAAANAADDGAIAPTQALLPGQAATSSNYTNYARGINGVMIDMANRPQGALTASDFSFRAGNVEDTGTWTPLAQNPAVSVRPGAGPNASDRVTLIWPDGAIRGKWLQVTVQPTGNTGLQAPDVFYFGNLPGEQDASATTAAVTASDVLAVRRAMGQVNAPIDNRRDVNHDGAVNALDYAAARANMGRSLHLISSAAPGGAPAAAAGSEIFSAIAIPPPRRLAYRPARVWDETAVSS